MIQVSHDLAETDGVVDVLAHQQGPLEQGVLTKFRDVHDRRFDEAVEEVDQGDRARVARDHDVGERQITVAAPDRDFQVAAPGEQPLDPRERHAVRLVLAARAQRRIDARELVHQFTGRDDFEP